MAHQATRRRVRRASVTGLERNPLVRAFAARLRRWRQERGLTLREVATALHVSVSIVSEWENCHRFPSARHLLAVSRHTGIPASEFFLSASRACR